jgi:F-type H+-transporting ATPase subunit gamma
MANLKDIRTRINSVKTTRQVTSAMKMVSAAKFKKAQDNVEHIRLYQNRLNTLLSDMSSALDDTTRAKLFGKKEKGKVLIVPICSNRGLAGAFNANIIKETERLLNTTFKNELKSGNLEIIVAGKQAEKALVSRNYPVIGHFNDMFQNVEWESVEVLADALLKHYMDGDYREIHFVYNKFNNASNQEVTVYQFLPVEPVIHQEAGYQIADLIVEPNRDEMVKALIPAAIRTSFYWVVLESLASEHGARMTAMSKATDNATDLINDLQLAYNKARQSAITTELTEIVSGAEALNG